MKRTGLEFFYSRPISEKVDFSELENLCGFLFPPMYKLFISSFIVGERNLQLEQYINERGDKINYPPMGCVFQAHRGLESFNGFNNIEELIKFNSDYYLFVEEDASLIRIGSTNVSAINILLGVGKENFDEIWVEDWDLGKCIEDGSIIKIADNIFEFTRSLIKSEYNEENLPIDSLYARLYKNWNEEYWQVRLAGTDAARTQVVKQIQP
jgi:hypothetical protein